MKKKPESLSIDMQSVKVLLQEVQKKMPQFNPLDGKSRNEAARLITLANGRNTGEPTEFFVSPTTLKRYWGCSKYGTRNKRYTPSTFILERLAVFCGFRNWTEFQKTNHSKTVEIILPYEEKLHFVDDGYWDANSATIGDVIYFGSPQKYIALERKIHEFELIDFKNIQCFTTFVSMDIQGIEVYKQPNKLPNIKILY